MEALNSPSWSGLDITRDPMMMVTWMVCPRCGAKGKITDREVMLLGSEELKRIGHSCDDRS